ncbi:MAG: histidine phosphatase family protein [Dehalococcoidia bacterium]
MTTRIILIRHGQTESNRTGYYMGHSGEDLNETGYSQVQRLSAKLAELPIASIYTSPLRRTLSTASVIAQPHKLEPIPVNDLIENYPGDWQGLNKDEILRKWPDLFQRWLTDPTAVTLPNGEKFEEVAERAIHAFDIILQNDESKYVIIVTHEIVVKVLVIYALGAPSSIYRRFTIDNTSRSTVRITNSRMNIETLNDTSHLR